MARRFIFIILVAITITSPLAQVISLKLKDEIRLFRHLGSINELFSIKDLFDQPEPIYSPETKL